jgi:hypothetical protein
MMDGPPHSKNNDIENNFENNNDDETTKISDNPEEDQDREKYEARATSSPSSSMVLQHLDASDCASHDTLDNSRRSSFDRTPTTAQSTDAMIALEATLPEKLQRLPYI